MCPDRTASALTAPCSRSPQACSVLKTTGPRRRLMAIVGRTGSGDQVFRPRKELREFATFTGYGAARMRESHSIPHWQSDGARSLARIGVLTHDFDPVPESEMWAMAPPGVSIHASRVPYNHDARSFAEPPHVDTATELLVGLAPHAIVYAYTGSSDVRGAEADDALQARLEKRAPGIPIILTASAASEALRTLRVHRLALIHPPWFSEEADGVFIGGNGLRAIGVIQALEESLGRPVLTANQVAFWRALRVAGMTSVVSHYGRIFTARAAQQQA